MVRSYGSANDRYQYHYNGYDTVYFKPTKEVNVNKTEILEKLEAMGPMSGKELRTAVWVTLAIILWMTDTLHGIDIGWVTLFMLWGWQCLRSAAF